MTTTNEIAARIAGHHHLPRAEAKAIVEAVFAAIVAASTAGAETSIPGFGKFKTKRVPERIGRNPATGTTMTFPATTKLTFVPAKKLRDALNKSSSE